MPVQPFGKADPYYDALRVMSNQNIQGAALGDTGTGGVLENKIYLWPADGSTISTFDADESGLIAANAAAVSGDTVWLPSIPIAVTVSITVTAGVIWRGISQNSILNLTGAVISGGSFPTTPILDNFNRTNEGPPPSASWANSLNYGLKVVGNQMVQAQTNALCDSRYLTSYGQEAEVYVDLVSSVAGLSNQEFWLFTGLDYLGGTSFYAIFDLTGPVVKLYDSGAFKSLKSFTFGVGDSVGLQITGTSNPVFHVWHKPSGGSWTEVHTYTYTGGTSRAGLLAITSWGTNVFDNFGGGDVVGPVSTPVSIILSAGSRLERITINQTDNSASDLVTIQAPASGAGYLSHVSIACTQSGSGDAVTLDGSTGDVFARDTSFNGQSTGGAGYGARGSSGIITLDDCSIAGSTAPLNGSGIVVHGNRFNPVSNEPAFGDRGAWDVLNYPARHAKDINDSNYQYHVPAISIGLENKILLWPSSGADFTYANYFDPDEAGLIAALAAAVSGDTIWLPSISIAMTAGISLTAGVTMRGISNKAALAFAGFAGVAITLLALARIENITITYDGTGQVSATGVLATSQPGGTSVHRCAVQVISATTNIGVQLSGVSTYNGASIHHSFVEAFNGGTNVALDIGDDAQAHYCYLSVNDGSTSNTALRFSGTATDISTALATHCWCLGGTGLSANARGCAVDAGKTGRATHCYFNGLTAGVVIAAGGTLSVYADQWNTISNLGTLIHLPGDLSSGGGGGGGGTQWFDVTDPTYGAIGDGTTDDTAAIAAAITAIPAGGGVLYFPAGTYKVTSGLTLSKPITVRGDGGVTSLYVNNAISQIDFTSATASLFTVSSPGCSFIDIAMSNTSGTPPSSGAGITVTSGNLMHYENIKVNAFYIDIDIQDGQMWVMEGAYLLAPVKYALKIADVAIPDGGDWSISNSNFISNAYNADAAIRLESAGGGKITNTKINAGNSGHLFVNGIDMAAAAGAGTSILLVSNSSIENVSGDGIHLRNATTGSWNQIVINGVQFGLYSNTGGHAISIVGVSANHFNSVVIDSNMFAATGSPGSAIDLQYVDGAYIGTFINNGFSSLLTQANCTNITQISGGVTSVTAGTGLTATPSNPFTTAGTILDANTGVTAATYGDAGNVAQIAINAQGRITSAVNVAIAIPFNVYNETQVADGISTIYYLANYATPGAIRVYIDGIRQPASDDSAATDVVTFTTVPTLGSLLLFDYEMDIV